MKYTTLFLDLDNTLLDFDKAEEKAIEKVLKKYDLPHDKETIKLYSAINLSFWKRFEKGEIPKDAIFEGRFKKLLQELNKDRNTALISDDYCGFLSEGYFVVDGADSILKYLKNKGYYICATTNGFAFTQKKRVIHSGLECYFDKVFISEDIGHQKPEKEYFDCVINNIPEKNRKNILIIGDSQSSDILGGINSGIDTCWYNPKNEEAKINSNFVINSLEELKNIL